MKPNILIITTDQQRYDSIAAYGSAFMRTPNLDRLTAEGALFERAYCASPVCTPARASIFSGQCISRHGAWNIGVNVPEDVPMVSHVLGAHGYRTHYIGKMHFQAYGTLEPGFGNDRSHESFGRWRDGFHFDGPYYGFQRVELACGHTTFGLYGHYGEWVRAQSTPEEFEAYQKARPLAGDGNHFGGTGYDWDLPERLHNSVWTADRTIEFLRRQEPRTPFLLAVGFQDPHHPHALPVDFTGRVDPETVPMPRWQEGELDDKPPHFALARTGRLKEMKKHGPFSVSGQHPETDDYRRVSPEDARRGRTYYYSMVQLIDREVGRILSALDACGLAENTLVVFTTDHGELLGDHGLWLKGPFHYEPLIRIPLIIRWPKGVPAGRRVSLPTSHVDIVPTVLAACGVPCGPSDGRNLLPLVRDGHLDREGVVVEYIDDPAGMRVKTIVTAEHKLSWYAGETYGELYDLKADPGEMHNYWDNPHHAAVKAQLLQALLAHTENVETYPEPRNDYA